MLIIQRIIKLATNYDNFVERDVPSNSCRKSTEACPNRIGLLL